jgi:hypothetical protein
LKRIESRSREKMTSLLAEQIGVREVVTRALHSVLGLDHMEEEIAESQVGKLVEPFSSFKQE